MEAPTVRLVARYNQIGFFLWFQLCQIANEQTYLELEQVSYTSIR